MSLVCWSWSAAACCPGLREASQKYLRSTVRACLPVCFPMMHLPISSLAKAVKEAHCSCHCEACCMHLWHRVGEIIPIIPLECLWINQFCMNKCSSLARLWFTKSLANMLVYMFERKGNKVLYWRKTHVQKKDRLRSFHIKSNTLFYANFHSHSSIFHFFKPDTEQRPPPESNSNIWSAESSGLLTLCKKTSGFQDFFSPLIPFFSGSALIDVQQTTVGKARSFSHGFFRHDVMFWWSSV